jgi:hypothetical protein
MACPHGGSPPKPWERTGVATIAMTPGSTSTTLPATSPAQGTGTAGTATPGAASTSYQQRWGTTSPGYGGGLYGGGTYGSPYARPYGGMYGGGTYGGGMYGGGMYGGGMYGGGGGMYGGGPFGAFGMQDPDKDLPGMSGMRHLEQMLMGFGRLTQVLEMNFEVLQHFLGSLMSLCERVRAMHADARQLTSTMGRQSLEFGKSSISTAREAKSRIRRHPVASFALVCFALSVLLRARAYGRRRGARLPRPPLGLDSAWPGR